MDSKVIAVYPYQQVDISRFQRPFVPDQEKIEKEKKRLLNRKSTWKEAEVVEPGAVVTCKMQSEVKKYNRDSIKITVGLGLFDQELEQQILGETSGSCLTIERQGKPVKLWVRDILQKDTPKMQDAFVRELQIPGVDTEEDYTEWLMEQQREEIFQNELYEVITYLVDTVLDNSQIEMAPREYEVYVEGQLSRLRLLTDMENLRLEDMTPEEFEGRIPVSSYEELVELVQKEARQDVAVALAGYGEAARQGYVVGSREYEDFVKTGAEEPGVDQESYRQAFPREFAELLMMSRFYYEKLENYIKNKLFVEG